MWSLLPYSQVFVRACHPLASISPLMVLSSGPPMSPAQSQGRTDTSKGSELFLAGLPQISSLQRACVLQACPCLHGTILSFRHASLYPRGESSKPLLGSWPAHPASRKEPEPPVPTPKRFDSVVGIIWPLDGRSGFESSHRSSVRSRASYLTSLEPVSPWGWSGLSHFLEMK